MVWLSSSLSLARMPPLGFTLYKYFLLGSGLAGLAG
jgi:hypothetical protein